MRPAVELAAGFLLAHAAPLLEEERHIDFPTLIADRANPVGLHRPGPRPALAAEDHPADAVEVDRTEVFEQGLDREHPQGRRGGSEMLDARQAVLAVLDADAEPDVRLAGREL